MKPNQRQHLEFQCIDCGTTYVDAYVPRCKKCQGLVEIQHDLSHARKRDSQDIAEAWIDLLPIIDAKNIRRVGITPTPCLHAETLGNTLGMKNIYLKVESHLPTRSTKDRMASIVFSMMSQLGHFELVTSSTGNSSNALAHAAQLHPDFTIHLFLGEDFAHRFRYKHPGIHLHVLTGKDFTQAFNHARDYAHSNQLPFEAGFFNPARREGLKLAYFEAVDQIPRPIDYYFQASSSAMGVYGTAKGAKELQQLGYIKDLPKMVCVQQDSCSPLVKAFAENSPVIKPEHIFHQPQGIAKAILRGDPSGCYPYVYRMLKETGGTAISVSETEILQAQAQVEELEGVTCCTNAATTIAALKKMSQQKQIDPQACVLLNLTG